MIRGGDSLYSILEHGRFRAELATVSVGDLLLQRGREALPRVASSSMPKNRVAILTWLHNRQLPVVRGLQIEPGDIIYLGEGTDSHHRTSAENEFVAVTLDASLLRRAMTDITGCELKVASGSILKPSGALRALLASVLEAAFRVAATSPDVLQCPFSAGALQDSILRAIVLCIEHGEARAERAQRRHRAFVARRFEAVIEASLDRPVSMPELARSIGASERMLRSLCQEQLGMSPRRFLAIRRLERIRRALAAAESGSTTVTDVAMSYGVWELGRFAGAYKSMFGEAPSVTLRRALA